MYVESGGYVHRTWAEELTVELAGVFAAFEAASGLQLCFRPLSDRWRDADGTRVRPSPYTDHRSAFCAATKARALAACIRCDLTDLPAACSQPRKHDRRPFVRTCHAGADEILVPVWKDGVLVAVLFAGQFVGGVRDDKRDARALPRLSTDDVARCLRLMLPMRSYLEDVLDRLEARRQGARDGRRAIIETYVHEALVQGPSLEGLAARLALSPSRAGHVVREATGRTFQQLVEEQRIGLAKDLLANTNSPMVWIAHQAGLKNGPYFSRYFKRKVGITPSEFRAQHDRALDV